MTALFVSGLVVAICAIVTLARFNLRRWLGYAGAVDISFTIMLMYLFAGTYSGIVAAAFAGLWMTVLLIGLRRVFGIEKYSPYRVAWYRGFMRFKWKQYGPSELTWFGIKRAMA